MGMEKLLNEAEIKTLLKPAYFSNITRQMMKEARVRMGVTGAEELTPIDALKKWLELKNTPPERMKVLMEYGEKVVVDEEGEE